MKSWLIVALMATVAFMAAPTPAEAKRFGGGSSFGIKRTAPPPQRAPDTPKPAQQPAANPATAGAPAAAAGGAAAAGARSWLGPVAGLAAGIGLVALMSHLGLGAELANFVMLALLAVAAVVAVRFLMRRFAGSSGRRPAMAGAGAAATPWSQREAGSSDAMARTSGAAASPFPTPQIGSALQPALAVEGADAADVADGSAPARAALPPDFDAAGFERIAKAIFIRMQTANDTADLNDLRQFTTPEVFAELRLQLQERGAAAQHTDVVEVNAEVIEVAEEDGQQIVSVRYHGQAVEAEGEAAQTFDEVWHLVKPVDDSRAWAIAGVQQRVDA